MLTDGLLFAENDEEYSLQANDSGFPMTLGLYLYSGGLSSQKVRWFIKFYGFEFDQESPYGRNLALHFLSHLSFENMDLLTALR